jgi:aryl-alcohol dehydrogenase-like predicted oxidoreductase
MNYRPLGTTGLQVSPLSFGASSLGSVFRDIDEAEGIRTVHTAVDRGVNLIDVSPYYGLTKAETVLGKALKQLDRSRVILSTKAGRYGQDSFDFSTRRIMQSVEESLQRLQTDYIDILHLHDIEFGSLQQVLEEGIPALNLLKEQGKIRFTGITGLPLNMFKIVLEQAHADTILSYCHYSLNDSTLLDLVPFLQEKNVGLINASPLSMGLLSLRGAPEWHPAGEEIKRACRQAAEYCKQQGSDIAKLAIQYSTSNPAIPTTLVSTASQHNINNNIDWAMEPIDQALLQEVLRILEPIRNRTWPSGHAVFN